MIVMLQVKSDLQVYFALPPTEALLEQFPCTLVQSYTCTNKHFTTPRQVLAMVDFGNVPYRH